MKINIVIIYSISSTRTYKFSTQVWYGMVCGKIFINNPKTRTQQTLPNQNSVQYSTVQLKCMHACICVFSSFKFH